MVCEVEALISCCEVSVSCLVLGILACEVRCMYLLFVYIHVCRG
jgi:hypothetical protein